MNKPIFVVSDLHIGSGGKRDSFSQHDRSRDFDRFLDFVRKEDGQLVILGDFIDLWRFSLKQIIRVRRDLLDRLSAMDVRCVVGNHDLALMRFAGSANVPHPFFRTVQLPFVKTIGGKQFCFMHGHELDPLNCRLTPGIGRFLGLSSSLAEYAKGDPFFSSDVIEDALAGIRQKLWAAPLSRVLPYTGCPQSVYNLIPQESQMIPGQKRIQKLISKVHRKKQTEGHDITISAHTHRSCRFENWYFNSGCWTGANHNFLQIHPSGRVGIFDWDKDCPRINETAIKLSSRIADCSAYAVMN